MQQFEFKHTVDGGELQVRCSAEVIDGRIKNVDIISIYYKGEKVLNIIKDLNPTRFMWIKTEANSTAINRFTRRHVNAAYDENPVATLHHKERY